MTKSSLLGAAAILAALDRHARIGAARDASARRLRATSWRGERSPSGHGFWPGAVAAGVAGAAIGTAAAIASAPYRGGNSYAYYGRGPQYDGSYAYYGLRQGTTTCGVEPYATYMGPDGRWYPC